LVAPNDSLFRIFFVSDLARRASGRFVVHSSALARHWNSNRFPVDLRLSGELLVAGEQWNIEHATMMNFGGRSRETGSRGQSSLPQGRPAFTKVTKITFSALNRS
jgi:hypothetical protein